MKEEAEKIFNNNGFNVSLDNRESGEKVKKLLSKILEKVSELKGLKGFDKSLEKKITFNNTAHEELNKGIEIAKPIVLNKFINN